MKRENELVRVKNVLSEDRKSFSENFTSLMIIDVSKTLSEYLNLKGLPIIETVKNGDDFTIKISVNAVGVKAFSTFPK